MNSFSEMFQMVLSNTWTYGVTFVVVLGLLVFIHEWGHYIVARLCGVKVEVFSIGFGKELFGWTAKSGTRWKVCLFPLGGYVKMFGDTDPTSAGYTDEIETEDGAKRHMTDNERNEAFFAKSLWKRAAIVFAGPGINYLFAIVVLAILYGFIGKPVTPPVVTGIEIGGAAERAGLRPHDVIKSINGEEIRSFDDLRRHVMLSLDETLVLGVERNGALMEIPATPYKISDTDRFGFAHERGYLGLIGPANGIAVSSIEAIDGQETNGDVQKNITLLKNHLDNDIVIQTQKATKDSETPPTKLIIHPPRDLNTFESEAGKNGEDAVIPLYLSKEKIGNDFIEYNPIESVGVAISETYRITTDTLHAIGQMIMGTRSAKELGGIIRIGAMAGEMAERGFVSLVVFTALLSINLGMINLFPIPMLDGGHLAMYAVEGVRGKPLSEKTQEYAFRFGLVVLVSLMVFSNLNDVLQLFVFSKG